MPFPEDTFNKRQFPYFGEAFHELHNLPGIYLQTVPTEMPKLGGGSLRGDIAYFVMMDDASIQIINVEDETSKVRKEELEKAYRYKTLFMYNHWKPVLTVITTTVPLDKCLKGLNYSQSDIFRPMIFSLPYDGAWNDLYNMVDRINHQELFTKTEGLKFITLPRCCKHDQELAVERICEVLPKINVENDFTKFELIYCMQCLIHKYAKTDDDILRLQEMILKNTETRYWKNSKNVHRQRDTRCHTLTKESDFRLKVKTFRDGFYSV